jgi:Flp pilus assembly protein TadD
MYRQHSDRTSKACWAVVLLTALLAGCASQTPGQPSEAAQPTADTSQAELPAANPARVEVDEGVGFTVTEVASLGSDVRASYREALQRLAQNDLQGGIALLKEVVDSAPDATAPYIDLGMAYARAEDYEAAVQSYLSALAVTPNHPVAHNELGIVYRKLGRFDEARASYERALAVYPGFHYARRNLAVLCDLYLADLDCALEQYRLYEAAVVDDHDVEIWIGDLENRIAVSQQEPPL